MRKYFNRTTIIIFLIFILQSLNVAWSITNPNIGNITTYFALFADGFIFGLLFVSLVNSR